MPDDGQPPDWDRIAAMIAFLQLLLQVITLRS
jgi:hypothetical protein